MGKAKSYAERLFELVSIDALDNESAKQAIQVPLEHESIQITDDAIDEIIAQTKGYPYFIQEWGKHVWDLVESSPIQKRMH